MRELLAAIGGLVIGAAGVWLFGKSLPPPAGSPAQRLEVVEQELATAQRTILALEEQYAVPPGNRFGANGRRLGGVARSSTRDGVRSIAKDVRDGKEVSMDQVFATMKPWMRDMAPLFNRMREINHEDWADKIVGEWSRQYDLSDDEKNKLRAWFMERNRQRQEELDNVLALDSSGFVDWMRAMEYDVHDTDGIDAVIEPFLDGEELAQFREQRLTERTQMVVNEANRGLARLDQVVALDPDQRDPVFDLLMRGAPGYVDGGTPETAPLDRPNRDYEIRSQLRPEQIEALDAHREERRVEAEKDLKRMGLSLPRDWDYLEQDLF